MTYTTKELARLVNVSEIMIRDWRKKGLKFTKSETGRKEVTFEMDDVISFLKTRGNTGRKYLERLNVRDDAKKEKTNIYNNGYIKYTKQMLIDNINAANRRKFTEWEIKRSIEMYKFVLNDLANSTPFVSLMDRSVFRKYADHFNQLSKLF